MKQDKIKYTHGKLVNIYIVYEISKSINISDCPTLENCLLGAASLTKNVHIDRCKYSGYGIRFDRHGSFSFSGIGLGRNVIIFGVDTSSSTKIEKGPTQRLEHALRAEKMYSINFTEHNKKFCSSLDYNRANSYLFVNGTEIHKFKAKGSEIVATPSCLENISKDWSVDNMKKLY